MLAETNEWTQTNSDGRFDFDTDLPRVTLTVQGRSNHFAPVIVTTHEEVHIDWHMQSVSLCGFIVMFD